MCGIAGLLGAEPTAPAVEAAVAAIAHRGPDGSGVFAAPGVRLIHTRLSIIEVSDLGAQPMTDPDTGVTIVFNGEIYNFRELRRRHLGGRRFAGDSDTEVVLALYLRFGADMVAMLRGMFAFVLWDPRDRTALLARDRFGIKPLVVARVGDGLGFASEAKALLALGVPAELNLAAVRAYLADGRTAHGPDTFFAGIESVPPATLLRWRDGALTASRYWTPPSGAAATPATEDEVWAALVDSMRAHMVADVEIGVSLSAGLDSSLLVALLAAVAPDARTKAFTFGFDEDAYDESRLVAARDYPVALDRHAVTLRPADMVPALERAIGVFETPLGGLGTLSSYALMELVRTRGVKVLLCGEGSDEIFAGYKYYFHAYLRDLHQAGDHARLRAELEAFNRLHGESMAVDDDAFRRTVLAEAQAVTAPDGTSLAGAGHVGPALAQAAEAADFPAPEAGSWLRRAMLADTTAKKLPKLLHFQDRASMAWGVETRVPFLDHVLWDTLSRLPPSVLLAGGETKALPKRLMARHSNLDHRSVIKRYVATPQREWIKGPLHAELRERVLSGRAVATGLLDGAAWDRDYRAYAASPELGNSFFVWKALNLELLLGAFFK